MTTHDYATTSGSPGDLDALSLGLHETLLSASKTITSGNVSGL